MIKIINETTAAVLAYGLYKQPNENKNILVFNLGGAKYDRLGGENFNKAKCFGKTILRLFLSDKKLLSIKEKLDMLLKKCANLYLRD